MAISRRLVVYWLPLFVWMGVVLAIGSTTALPLTEANLFRWLVRKGIHVGEYAVLGWLFYRSLAQEVRGFRPGLAFAALLLTAGSGGFDEWRQSFIPGRSGRLLDVGIDAVGGGAGQMLAWVLSRIRGSSGIAARIT